MKCLTVCQPWAWAIIHGPKRIENRTWPTNYRGPLIIHAGKSRQWLGTEGDSLPDLPDYDQLEYGAILGTVTLVDCVPYAERAGEAFAEGPWCWILVDPKPLPAPVPYKGAMGLFEVPESALKIEPVQATVPASDLLF